MKLTFQLAIVASLSLAACAPAMRTMPDGRVLAMTTVGDTLDRSASYTQILEPVGTDANGNPTYRQVAGDLTVGSTVAGDTIRAAVPTAIGAGIQAAGAIRATQIKADASRCPNPDGSGGTIICNSTVALGGTGVASAGAIADANTSVVITESTCPSGGCRGSDFDF